MILSFEPAELTEIKESQESETHVFTIIAPLGEEFTTTLEVRRIDGVPALTNILQVGKKYIISIEEVA